MIDKGLLVSSQDIPDQSLDPQRQGCSIKAALWLLLAQPKPQPKGPNSSLNIRSLVTVPPKSQKCPPPCQRAGSATGLSLCPCGNQSHLGLVDSKALECLSLHRIVLYSHSHQSCPSASPLPPARESPFIPDVLSLGPRQS